VIFLALKKIALLTGGGNAPGENAFLLAATKTARNLGYEVVGIRNGWAGLIKHFEQPLYEHDFTNLLTDAGTLIGTSRENPFEKGNDRSQIVVDNLQQHNIDALIVKGGNDTLSAALKLMSKYPRIVGAAKTIDNDMQPYCIGFDTAKRNAQDFILKLHAPAYSHDRIYICEIMGRKCGYLTLEAGLAGGADMILTPEVTKDKLDINVVCKELKRILDKKVGHNKFKKSYAIIVVAEGVEYGKGSNSYVDAFRNEELKGVGGRLLVAIQEKFKENYGMAPEMRYVRPDHILRGGTTSPLDISMGMKYGKAAVEYASKGMFGLVPVVDMGTEQIKPMKIEDVIKPKQVPEYLIKLYENLVSFGV
jgi:6-phosphofructokinase 1